MLNYQSVSFLHIQAAKIVQILPQERKIVSWKCCAMINVDVAIQLARVFAAAALTRFSWNIPGSVLERPRPYMHTDRYCTYTINMIYITRKSIVHLVFVAMDFYEMRRKLLVPGGDRIRIISDIFYINLNGDTRCGDLDSKCHNHLQTMSSQ